MSKIRSNFSSYLKSLGAIALVASCAGWVATSALAQDPAPGGKRIVVSTGDLDLSHQAGARVLIARIEAAATKVCGGLPDIRDLERRNIYLKCMDATMDRAVASVNAPVVAVLTGRPLPRQASADR